MGVLRAIARGTALAGAVVAGGALVVTARSMLATPQPLASALEGESRIFRFRNGDIFYKVRGPADAQPILLLHSIHLSASSFEWRKNFSALSQNFRVYAPDLHGFGLSDRPFTEYNAEMYIHLIGDFAREVIARPAMLVARGQSAAFATRAAALDSQLFSRLVFISPNGILPAPSAEGQEKRAGALRGLLRRLGESALAQVPYAFLTTKPALSLFIARQSYANPEQITPDIVEQFYATTHQFGARFAPLAFISGRLDIDVASDFAALPQPVLLVWGEEDAINPATTAEGLGKLNHHARLELIPQAGNAVQEEQADEINELLRAWFLAPLELVDPTRKAQMSAPATATREPARKEPAAAPEATPAARPEAAAPARQGAGNGKALGASITPAEAPITEAPQAQPPAQAKTPAIETPQTEPPARVETPAAEALPAEKTAQTSEELAQTEVQAVAEILSQAPEPAAPASEPPAPAAPAKPPTSHAPRRPAQKASPTRQTQAGRAAQQAQQRESARQASPDTEGKEPPPRSSGGGKKRN